MPDVFLYTVPSDTNPNDVRLRDPTGVLGPQAYSLVCSPGSFALTGSSATLKTGRNLPLAAGSFTLTGSATGLIRGVTFPAAAGSFTLTGSAITLKTGRTLPLAAGGFNLSGASVTLQTGRVLPLASGVFTITGSDATLTYTPGTPTTQNYSLALDPGVFTFTGSTVSFTATGQSQAGWTTHFYKRRNKRKSKPSDIEEFFNTFETKLIDEAPAPIAEQAHEAQAASQAYLKTNEDSAEAKALMAKALAEINEFYALLRAEDKRRRDEQDEDELEEFLLLGL